MIIVFLFVVSDPIVQLMVAQEDRQQRPSQPGDQSGSLFLPDQQNVTGNQTDESISPDQLDTTGLASMLVGDATESIQNGDIQTALSALNLARQELSGSGGGEFNPKVVEK